MIKLPSNYCVVIRSLSPPLLTLTIFCRFDHLIENFLYNS